jgi:hypothetical protein
LGHIFHEKSFIQDEIIFFRIKESAKKHRLPQAAFPTPPICKVVGLAITHKRTAKVGLEVRRGSRNFRI